MNLLTDDEKAKADLEALKAAQPSWRADNLGVRGVPVTVSSAKANLNWESSVTFRRPVVDLE
jgi:hypothetical protein